MHGTLHLFNNTAEKEKPAEKPKAPPQVNGNGAKVKDSPKGDSAVSGVKGQGSEAKGSANGSGGAAEDVLDEETLRANRAKLFGGKTNKSAGKAEASAG